MAIDGKYGRVTLEHGVIGEDEPVVVFRAQDETTIHLLDYYRILCVLAGSPARHLALIDKTRATFHDWQGEHDVKVPDSESSRTWGIV